MFYRLILSTSSDLSRALIQAQQEIDRLTPSTRLKRLLLLCLQAQQGSLQPLLECDLSYLNPLAHSVGEWQFVRVEFCDKDRYLLHFEYDWQVFSCMGLNASGRFVDKVAFCLEPNGVLCFDLHGFGHLSPADEL